MKTILAIVCIIIIISFATIFWLYTCNKTPCCIYCIMITGKDNQRRCFARSAINNFKEQDYPNKRLIIINHDSDKIPACPPQEDESIFEFFVPKKTLGDLRNIALQLVPIDSMWTVWDDDDYRVPSYLSMLADRLKQSHSDVVAFTKRIECNIKKRFVWEMELKTGFVLVLAKQDLRIKYQQKDSMEDLNLLSDFKNLGKKLHIWENNPSDMYIRLVHNNNTSLYVNKDKEKIINPHDKTSAYVEKNVDNATRMRVLKTMDTKFMTCF